MLTLDPDFFTGAIHFSDEFEGNPRVVIPLSVKGALIYAVVDTGAPYSILSREIAEELGIDTDDGIDEVLSTRKGRVEGKICRIAVSLDSTVASGTGIDLEASFFIPLPGELWNQDYHFIGLNTFLFAIRFAVDPHNNLFYFGSNPL